MKTGVNVVEDSEENRQICRKYCGVCPSYKQNALGQSQPDVLFCARGVSSAASPKKLNCYCPACEIYTKNSLVIGHFCMKQ
jgi:hypothetical protein